MTSKKGECRYRARAQTCRPRSVRVFSIFVKLFTAEKFPLKNIQYDMKISNLKSIMEFATGIPVHVQRIIYLDDDELLDHTYIRSNYIVPGTTLEMRVLPMWKELVEACVANDIEWVLRLGVTQASTYHTPNSNYMSKQDRKAWIKARAFLALFIAAHRGHEKLVRTLLESGANVNSSSPFGRTPLHVAAAQGHDQIVHLLLTKGADIDAVDRMGDSAQSIATKFGHKSCERHLFLFRWQEKQTRPCAPMPLMAHQYYDSAFPVWRKGEQCQIYLMNILPPGEFEGTQLSSPRSRSHSATKRNEDLETNVQDKKLLSVSDGEKLRAQSGPSRSGNKHLSFNEWLLQKKSDEQRIINMKKKKLKMKQLEEEERKRLEDEKKAFEATLAVHKEAANLSEAKDIKLTLKVSKQLGYLRTYLRSLDKGRKGNYFYSYEEWLDIKEAAVLGTRCKTMHAI